MKMRLFLGMKQNEIIQQHQTLSAVVSAAFGGGSSGAKNQSEPPENTRMIETEADVHALMNILNG